MKWYDWHTHKKYTNKDIFFIRNSYAFYHLKSFPDYAISCGIHPWYIQRKDVKAQLEYLEQLCSEKRIIKIGECGLDKNTKTPLGVQMEVFKLQLKIAIQYQLEVIVHCVGFYDLLLEIIKEYPHLRYYFHAYSGNKIQTEKFITTQIEIKFGFGMRELRRKKKMMDILPIIPKESMGLETDNSKFQIKEVQSYFEKLLYPELLGSS